MQQRNWRIGLAIGLAAFTSACQFLPTGLSGEPPKTPDAATPTPALPGGAGADASPTPSATPAPERSTPPGASPSPSAKASATPTPRGSTTPMPSPTPTANITFEAPLTTADFTRTSLEIRVRAVPPAGQTLSEITLLYNGRELKKQTGKNELFSVTGWDPNQINNLATPADAGKVPFGTHTLTARVKAGSTVTTKDFTFTKPFHIRNWPATVPDGAGTRTVPPLGTPRAFAGAYGFEGRMYAIFGENPAGTPGTPGTPVTPASNIEWLNVNLFEIPTWEPRSSSGLTWRERPAVAGAKDKIYVVGGRTGGVPTRSVQYYDVYQQTSVAAPDLFIQTGPGATAPHPVWEAAAAVLDGAALYVAGGSTGADYGSATSRAFRLTLDAQGRPSGTWEELPRLPEGRMAATLVAHGGAVYLIGGQTNSGNRLEPILKYSPGATSWERVGVLHRGLTHAAAAVMNNEIWVFGGETGLTPALVRDVVRLNIGTGAVSTHLGPNANLPEGRAGMGVAVVNGQVYLLGGHKPDAAGNPVVSDDVLRADTL